MVGSVHDAAWQTAARQTSVCATPGRTGRKRTSKVGRGGPPALITSAYTLNNLHVCSYASQPSSSLPPTLRLESNHTGSATNDLCIPFLRAGWGRGSTLHTSSCTSIRGSGVANHLVLIVALRLFFWKRYMGRLGITMPSLLKQYQQRRPRQ